MKKSTLNWLNKVLKAKIEAPKTEKKPRQPRAKKQVVYANPEDVRRRVRQAYDIIDRQFEPDRQEEAQRKKIVKSILYDHFKQDIRERRIAEQNMTVRTTVERIKYTEYNFPTGFRTLDDVKANDMERLYKFIGKLKAKENRRTVIYINFYSERSDKSGNEINRWYKLRPQNFIEFITAYGTVLNILYLKSVTIVEVPMQGACDTRPHTVTMNFEDENGESIQVTVQSVKSSGDNCLLNAMSQCAQAGRGFRADKFRQEMQIPAGPIGTEWCLPIAVKMGITMALYRANDNTLEVVCQSDTVSDKHVNLLLQNGHYWVITSDVRKFNQIAKTHTSVSEAEVDYFINSLKAFPVKKKISENFDFIEADTDCADPEYESLVEALRTANDIFNAVEQNIRDEQEIEEEDCVQVGQHLDTTDFEVVQFLRTMENPSLQDVQDVVNQGLNLLIVGAGGCGKTFLLKALSDVAYTATTACAAELLGGQTVQSHMSKNRSPNGERLVVDEVSMMGSCLFENLFDWATRGKKAQLILSGDFLQLPPVNDRFFFQASSFYQFAKNAVMVRLTEVKRQDNKNQAKFLNNLREGVIDRKWIEKLQKNKVDNPQLVLSAKRDFVEFHNKTKLEMLGNEIIDYAGYVTKKDGSQKVVHNSIAVGAKAIITKNMEGVYNGQRVEVTACGTETVTVVDDKGKSHTFGYVDDIENGKVVEHYIPVSVCYALTIHKSQGQTVDSAVVYVDNMFEQGMAYVALSRVRDLNNLEIRGIVNLDEKGWQPNSYALAFYRSGKIMSADQMLFIPNTKKQLKGVRRM